MINNREGMLFLYVITSHGRQSIPFDPEDRLIDILIKNDIPWSSVSIYAVKNSSKEAVLYSGLNVKMKELNTHISELHLYFNRNVNPFIFSLNQFKVIDKDSGQGEQKLEYFYRSLDNKKSTCDTFLKKLNTEECQSIISQQVAETIQQNIPPHSSLVVGISGGGDSNALLHGLTQIKEIHDLAIHPIIIKGIPDWDAGVERAQALCEKYDLNLTIVEQEEVQSLLNIRGTKVPLIDRFEKIFPGDDFEFLGTLLVRLALTKYAKKFNTPYICTGVNLEDAVCENLFRISTGLKPASYPKRIIGDMQLLFPLWLCPKRIIDGCFPKYSLQNYQARYPCFSLGRNLYYSIVFSTQSQFPGFIEQMAQGLSELSQNDPVVYKYDEQLGFYVERFIPFPLREKFRQLVMNEETVA